MGKMELVHPVESNNGKRRKESKPEKGSWQRGEGMGVRIEWKKSSSTALQ